MAGSSAGMFSSPLTFGRYISRRTGPSNTYFINHQNIGTTPRYDPLNGPRVTVHIDYRSGSGKGNCQDDGVRTPGMDVRRDSRGPGGGGRSVHALPARPAVPEPVTAALSGPLLL